MTGQSPTPALTKGWTGPVTLSSQPRSVAFHIGAHKTASTHLQRCLTRVRYRLAQRGVQVYAPVHLREKGRGLRDRLGLPKSSTHPGIVLAPDVRAAEVDALWQTTHRLVFTEENFTGTLLNRWGNVRTPLYPLAAERLSALSDVLAPDGIEVFLAIRNPTHFLTSAYGQSLMGGARIPLPVFHERNPPNEIDWPALCDRLLAAPGVRSLTVWRYEDYLPCFGQIVTALLGGRAAAAVKPVAGRVHEGLSAAAVAHILDHAGLKGPDDSVAEARAAYPVGDTWPRFDGYDAETHALSQELYRDQVAAIEAMPGVTRLRPEPPTEP